MFVIQPDSCHTSYFRPVLGLNFVVACFDIIYSPYTCWVAPTFHDHKPGKDSTLRGCTSRENKKLHITVRNSALYNIKSDQLSWGDAIHIQSQFSGKMMQEDHLKPRSLRLARLHCQIKQIKVFKIRTMVKISWSRGVHWRKAVRSSKRSQSRLVENGRSRRAHRHLDYLSSNSSSNETYLSLNTCFNFK